MSLKILMGCIFSSLLLISCSTKETQLMWTTGSTLDNITNQIMGTKTILALGDSLTAGYWLEIAQSYPSKLGVILNENWYNYKVINAGVSGDTSKNLLNRANLYSDKNPDIVILVIGWNDGLRWQSLQDLEINIQSIINIYKWDATVVLGWMEIPVNFWLSYTREFKQMYFNIAKNNPDIYFIESFLKDVGWVWALNQADWIHPTSKWYNLIVKNLYEFLQDEDITKK
jgi:acyl-CoA thioesterase-1